MRLAFIFLLFASACSSAPEKTAPATSKPVLSSSVNVVEIEAVVAYAPRRGQEMENALLLSPKIHSCLRLAPEIRDVKFSVGIEGYLDYKGVIETVTVSAPSEPLRACLAREVAATKLGRGRAGPFKMQLNRSAASENNSKSVLLDLSAEKIPLKKWE